MHAGICDDEKPIRSYIRKLIEQQEEGCAVTEFSSGEELLDYLEAPDHRPIDLLFLDISLSGTDGVDVARQVRRQAAETRHSFWEGLPLIIFVTGYAEYMPEAFDVHAFQYIVKPVQEADFVRIFGQAVQACRQLAGRQTKKKKEILLKNGSVTRKFSLDEIYYIEGNNRKVIVCLPHEKIECYAKLADLEKELEPDFFRIHRGYLIHMKYVERYDRKQVYMKNQDCLLLSRYKYQEFVHAYLNYVKGESL